MQRRTICVAATQRSGHHAFLEWICRNLGTSYLYLNRLEPHAEGLSATQVVRNADPAGDPDAETRERLRAVRAIAPAELAGIAALLSSFENRTLDEVLASSAFAQQREFAGATAPGQATFVLFLRDPINAIASLRQIRTPDRFTNAMPNQVASWISHARVFLGEDDLAARLPGWNIVVASYNRFIRHEDVRRELGERLDLQGHAWSRELSRFGGGGNTRFEDRDAYQASVDALEDRWRAVGDLSFLKPVLADAEFRRLARRYYEEIGRAEILDAVLTEATRA